MKRRKDKYLAAIISIAMIATMSVPVFAEINTVSNEELQIPENIIEENNDVKDADNYDKNITEDTNDTEEVNDVNFEEEPEQYIDIENAGYELDAETAERMDSFIHEYEKQFEVIDNKIVTDNVDVEYFEEKYGAEIVEIANENIEVINEEAEEGEIEITDNGTIYETNDTDMFIQGKVNVTKSVTYWWGRINYLSYKNANKMKKSLTNYKKASTVISEVAGLVSFVSKNPHVAGFSLGNMGIAHYCSYFKKRISACNKSGKGIKYKIYWSMNYTMRTQGKAW